MQLNEWPDILPLVQSALNSAAAPSRGNIAPVTAFMGLNPTPPITTFLRTTTVTPLTLTLLQQERLLNIKALQASVADLHPIVDTSVRTNRERSRSAASRGQSANFSEGDFVLLAREEFFAGEKLALRWGGPRQIVKALNDYVFQIRDLRNGSLEDIRGTRLKYYSDSSLDSSAILSHIISSETGMPVSRLMALVETPDGLKVIVRWKGLPNSQDSAEPLQHVHKDVPQMLHRLLQRKNTPQHLVAKARAELAL